MGGPLLTGEQRLGDWLGFHPDSVQLWDLEFPDIKISYRSSGILFQSRSRVEVITIDAYFGHIVV